MKSLDQHLKKLLPKCKEFHIVSATLGSQGFARIEPYILAALKNGAIGQMIIGLDMLTTDPKALKQLYVLQTKHTPNLMVKLFTRRGGIFHPKVTVIKNGRTETVVIGSSNLSKHAFDHNIEVDLVIKDKASIRSVMNEYYSWWQSTECEPLSRRTIAVAEKFWLKGKAIRSVKPPAHLTAAPKVPSRIRGCTFVFTGAFSTAKSGWVVRNDLRDIVETFEGHFVNSDRQVKNASCLVNSGGVSPYGGDTKKLLAARQFGVPIISPAKFWKLVEAEKQLRKKRKR